MGYSRLSRKKDSIIRKSCNGLGEVFDLTRMDHYRLTEDEYDFLIEQLTDEDMDLIVSYELTFSEKKKLLNVLKNYLNQ